MIRLLRFLCRKLEQYDRWERSVKTTIRKSGGKPW